MTQSQHSFLLLSEAKYLLHGSNDEMTLPITSMIDLKELVSALMLLNSHCNPTLE
jgi:hypothetical protein